MFASPWIAALVALFAWWLFTGVILLLVRRSDTRADTRTDARPQAPTADKGSAWALLSFPIFVAGVAGVVLSAATLSVLNVYLAFLSVLLIWGWIEFAFLLGVITGPERTPCPDDLQGLARFERAWNTLYHHEFLLLGGVMIVTVATTAAENTFGFWAYLVLFAARISAKLNLFFGVPRINTEFVPRRLDHLKSYFRQGPITAAFPIGVTLLSLMTGYFASLLISVNVEAAVVGYALLTALAGLATFEHWLMVLPLPDAKLWRWMLPALPNTSKTGQSHEL